MTAAEAKAKARQTIEAHVRASVAESDRRLVEAVADGHLDVDTAAATSAAIHSDTAARLPQVLRDMDHRIDALAAESEGN